MLWVAIFANLCAASAFGPPPCAGSEIEIFPSKCSTKPAGPPAGDAQGSYCSKGCSTVSDCPTIEGTTAACSMNQGHGQHYCEYKCNRDADCQSPIGGACQKNIVSKICTYLAPRPGPSPPSPQPSPPPSPAPKPSPTSDNRDILVQGAMFVDGKSGRPVVLTGPNVVMKGTPWIPAVTGDQRCGHVSSPSCKTFNAADARHVKDIGYNMIRLGVVWAGGQPTSAPELDADFVARLRTILDLCHEHGIAVILDVHQDAVGTAVCGEGVPQWFSNLATPLQVGLPLTPLIGGYPHGCGPSDFGNWAKYAHDPDYNIKNECCRKLNQDGWIKLVTTIQAQETMAYLFSQEGRGYFANYTRLLAAAVRDKPAAVAIELMNEPPAIERGLMYTTWEACYDAIRSESATIAVGIMETGEIPLTLGTLGLDNATVAWLRSARNLFYAFHYYSPPSKTPEEAVGFAEAHALHWGMPSLLTEFGGYGDGCRVARLANKRGIGFSYWHYDDYCWPMKTGGSLPSGDRWGACITGWGSGNSDWTCGGLHHGSSEINAWGNGTFVVV